MSRVADLKRGQRFQGKVHGYTPNTTFLVEDIKPSLDLEDHVRIFITTKRGSRKTLRLPLDMKINILRSRKNRKPGPGTKCKCYNHLGSKKMLHKSEDAALKAIMRRHIHYGAHRTYECPTEPGKYHVTSKVDSTQSS